MNYYGPIVYIVATLAALGWLAYSGSTSQAVLIGLTTVIMGYPCALGITTPMVLTLAILALITAPIAIGVMTASIFAVLLSTLSLLRLKLNDSGSDDIEGLSETIIPARNIHCESCSRSIISKLSLLPGVRKVMPDIGRKEVLIAYEPSRVSEEQLRGQLDQLGFR